jgi:WD40 repeat protein/serine/threonine protein kinase
VGSADSEQFVVLNRLADEFAERFRRGDRPTLEEYIDRYPKLAEDIRELFPAMVEMEQVKEERESLSEPAAVSPLPPLERLGDYRIIREVARGGMGVVYEAEQVSLGRHVALKVLPKQVLIDSRTKRRFEREARAAAKLHHTNIVPVFGVGEHDGLPYYVMQFINGTGLDQVIDELVRMGPSFKSPTVPPTAAARSDVSAIAQSLLTGAYQPADDPTATRDEVAKPVNNSNPRIASGRSDSFSIGSSVNLPGQSDSSSGSGTRKLTYWQSVGRVGLQVAEALEYAHKQGILHRDVKPSNLLLDMAGTVWVTDFGLAKTDDQQDLTHTGDILGTLRYMPPEAFNGKFDSRSDVYSLGLTLYELVAQRPGFNECDRNKLIKQVTASDVTPLRRVKQGVPRDLETIIHKCIEREPESRYQKAEDLAEDLRRFLADRTIQARRATIWEQTWRWARRNPSVAGLLGVVTWLLLGVSIASSLAAVKFRQARDDADKARQGAESATSAERWERYRANMMAASSALQLHNVSAAQSALDATPEEHRAWEWKYFLHQFDTAQQVFQFGDDVRSIAISSDGAIAAVQFESGPVRLWNLASRQEVTSLHNQSPATSLLFSPDNTLIAYEDGDKIVLWDVAAQRERAVLSHVGKRFHCLDFSPDGTRLAVGFADVSPVVWDVTTGKRQLLRGHHEDVDDLALENLAFSPDGHRVASAGGTDRTVRLWNVESGELLTILSPHDGPTSQAIFSPQGDRVLSVEAYPGTALRLWNAETGELLAVMRGHTNAAEKAAFSPDGTRIASGGHDQTVRLWDARTGHPLASREGHRGLINSLGFSPDGKYLLSASNDQTARLWDAMTGEPLGVLHGHTRAILERSTRYTPDGRTIITASAADGSVRRWDARRAEGNGFLRGHESFVYSVAFHPDGERVASAAWDGTVRVWDATTGRQTLLLDYPFTPATQFRIVSSVAFHPAGKLLAALGRDGAVRFWDLRTGAQSFCLQLTPYQEHGSDPRIAFNACGNLLAVPSGHDNMVRLWDVERRAEIAVLKGHSSWIFEACFAPDDSWLATAGFDRTVRIWDMATHEQIRVLEGHTDAVQSVAVSRDGKWLASGAWDGTVRLWDTSTWDELAVLKHGSGVYGVAFTGDGARLVSACADNLIRFWDTATHQLVAELDGHQAYVHQIAFSPDGTRLVSGSGDFTLRVWDSLSVQERSRTSRQR